MLLATSCEPDLYKDVPQSKVYIPASGFYSSPVYYFGANETIQETLTIRVYRSGLTKGDVTLSLKADEAILAEYNLKNGTKKVGLPSSCYAFPSSVVIPDGKNDAVVNITIYPDKIHSELGFDKKDYVVPFKVQNVEGGGALLNDTKAVYIVELFSAKPTFSFKTPAFIAKNFTDEDVKADVGVLVKTDYPKNRWDITLNFDVLPELVAAYNAENNTSFEFPDASMYALKSKTAVIPANSSEVSFPITIDPTKLDPTKTYLIPVKLISSSMFEINEAKSVVYLKLEVKNKYLGWYTVHANPGNYEYPGGDYPRFINAISSNKLQTPFSYWYRFSESSWDPAEEGILTLTVNSNNTVTVESWNSTVKISGNESTWDPVKKEFNLVFTADIPGDGVYVIHETMFNKRDKIE